MRIYETDSPQQIKHRLRSSEEIRMYRSVTVFYIIAAAVMAGILFPLTMLQGDLIPEARGYIALIIAICCLPSPLICLIRRILIFRKWKHYRFYHVKLTNLHRCPWAGYSYFTVLLDDGQEKTIVNTHSIFTTHSLFTPRLSDYVNHQAVVGYNPETEQVVFLG